MTEGRRTSRAYRTAVYCVLVIGALPILLPIYWMVLASLKTVEQLHVSPPSWTPVVPRHFVTLEGRETQIIVMDDGSVSGTKVARVKLVRRDDDPLRLEPGRIQTSTETQFYAVIEGVRHRIEPRDSGAAQPGQNLEVALLDRHRRAWIDPASIETREPRWFWAVLGLDIPVRIDAGRSSETASHIVGWAAEPPAVAVADELFSEDPTGRVRWRERSLPAEQIARVAQGGYVRVRLVCPPDGLDVPSGELWRESGSGQSVRIDDHSRNVRVLRGPDERGLVEVELSDEYESVRIPPERLERVARTVHKVVLLGVPHLVELVQGNSPARPGATVAVRVPGALALAADRIRSESRLEPQWGNYARAWREQRFDLFVVNTLFIAALVVVGTVLSCGLVGYAFARLDFRGRDGLFLLLLATMMIPGQVTSIPTFVLFVKLGWIDTYLPLIVPHLLAHSAFFVFLYRQFMSTIPVDLEDAARIDGCGPLATWWLIMMPLSRPIVVTVAVFAFMGVWSDFLYPLLYINSDEKQTVALGLQNFKSAFQDFDPQLLMAASTMMIAPTVLLFFFAQRAFMRGVVVTGVKG